MTMLNNLFNSLKSWLFSESEFIKYQYDLFFFVITELITFVVVAVVTSLTTEICGLGMLAN